MPPRQVLVVDDDPLVLANTAAMLEDLGHVVQTATCGEEALRLLGRSQPFDLLVTDQLMPGMTGSQLARCIRRTAPDLPVLIVSGFAELEESEAGKFPMLPKPFDRDRLQQALTELLQPAKVVPFRRPATARN
jgi:CheY-like chemotaxis protein